MNMIEVSAPGSLMLCGEHAVLHGQTAIACAVNKRINVKLVPRNDDTFVIHSAIGTYQGEVKEPKIDSRFLFIIEAVKLLQPSGGFELDIISEFSHQVGLGSSAAVTVAVCTALSLFNGEDPCNERLFDIALQCVLNIQGKGSGSDLAASVYGGIVSLKVTEESQREVGKLNCELPPLGLYYCGYKMKTPAVIELVNQKCSQAPALYRSLYKLMGETSLQATVAICANNWTKTGQLFNFYQGLMDALGVNDSTLAQIIYSLRQDPEVYGSKISGSGLGDCVISLGRPKQEINLGSKIDIDISTEGVSYNVH